MNRFARLLFGLTALLVFGLLLWRPWEGGLPPAGPPGSLLPKGEKGSAPPPEDRTSLPLRRKTLAAPVEPGESSTASACRVTGRLLHQGRPVAGAEVEWLLPLPGTRIRAPRAASCRTGKEGRFLLSVPPGRRGILRARTPGLPPLVTEERRAPDPGGWLFLGDLSFPDPLALEVQVLDRVTGDPLAGARVSLSPPPGPLLPWGDLPRAAADGRGRARLAPLPEGTWRIRVEAPGYSPYRKTLEVSPREAPRTLQVYLAKGPGLRGRVVDSRGDPVPGARIDFEPFLQGEEDHRAGGSLRAGPDGTFRIPGLEEGDWSLDARSPGRALPRPVKTACPREAPLTLVLESLPTLSGRVRLPSGPAPGFRGGKAALAPPGAFGGAWILSPLARPAALDGKGRFRITLERFPPPGTQWIVLAWIPGFPPGESRKFFFEKGRGPGDLEIPLPRPGRVRGRVLPPRGSRVYVPPSSLLPYPPFLPFQGALSLRPGPEGSFLLGPLAPGERTIRFSAPGRVTLERVLSILPGKTLDLGTVSLLPGITVGGILLGPSGKPEPGGLVWLRPTSGGTPYKTLAGPGGRFRFPPVPPGKYFLQGCRREAGPLGALEDYAASRCLLVLTGRERRIRRTITLQRRH